MSRQLGIRTLAVAGLLLVVTVLGLAAKVGHDASQYLQTVSTQKNWTSAGLVPERATTESGASTPEVPTAGGSEGAQGAELGAVAAR